MWVLLSLVAVVGAQTPVLNPNCPDYSPPFIPVDCGQNAYWETCPAECPRGQNCSLIWSRIPCIPSDDYCCEPICRCIDGHFRNDDMECISAQQCMGQSDEPSPNPRSPRSLGPPNPKPRPLPRPHKKCPVNEQWMKCRTICPPQKCDISYTSYLCTADIRCEPGCDCIKDHLRLPNGTCVFNNDCPPPPTAEPPTEEPAPIIEVDCGQNAYWETCPAECPRGQNCSLLWSKFRCTPSENYCCVPTCRCIDGYYRNNNFECISGQQCTSSQSDEPCPKPRIPRSPGPQRPLPRPPVRCPVNEQWEKCRTICPPQNCDISYTSYGCPDVIRCEPGCDCIKDHLRLPNGTCVFNNDCPPPPTAEPPTEEPEPICGYNEELVECPEICPPRTCESLYRAYSCPQIAPEVSCTPGCNCISGHLKNSSGICIPSKECPPAPWVTPIPKPRPPRALPACGYNEVAVDRPQTCPPQDCDALYLNYLCAQEDSDVPRESGCNCISGHLRNSSGLCVPTEECPPAPWATPNPRPRPPRALPECGYNEVAVDCPQTCPPQDCEARYLEYLCAQVDPEVPCESGCNCISGHLRNSSGICVPAEECPPAPLFPPILQRICGDTEEVVDCPQTCPPQHCNSLYIQYSCVAPDPNANCTIGCNCIQGYLRNESNICVPVAECPKGPLVPIEPEPTTDTPEPPNNICGTNETYVSCSATCPPYDTCPENDSRDIILCDIPDPCPPGCICKVGYRKRSRDDSTCILSEECAPIKCTRPNEVYDPCPNGCLAEFCTDIDNQPSTCNELIRNCQPKCICAHGYYRNESDICVPESECRSNNIPRPCCGANETYVNCDVGCPNNHCPTNDNRGILICDPPNPCPPGCACKLGYRRRSLDDPTCILAEECPPVECKRDNEVWSPCNDCLAESCEDIDNQPTTCNTLVHNCQPQCICDKGYFRNDSDDCVAANECNPCGTNKTTVFCTFVCPHQVCPKDDSLLQLACKPPRDCPSGCGCKDGYLYTSYDDDTCVLARDCPQRPCTRENEEWNPCSKACLQERCEDITNPQTECYEPEGYCAPKCVCIQGYYRNATDSCVPANQCG